MVVTVDRSNKTAARYHFLTVLDLLPFVSTWRNSETILTLHSHLHGRKSITALSVCAVPYQETDRSLDVHRS